jgi:hypothetical protein
MSNEEGRQGLLTDQLHLQQRSDFRLKMAVTLLFLSSLGTGVLLWNIIGTENSWSQFLLKVIAGVYAVRNILVAMIFVEFLFFNVKGCSKLLLYIAALIATGTDSVFSYFHFFSDLVTAV